MAVAKLQNKLDKEDSGLSLLAGRLASSPRSQRIGLVLLDAAKVERDLHTGGETITVRITELEEVPPRDVTGAIEMLRDARAARWGLDGWKSGDLPQLFPEGAVVDPNTGEIRLPSDETPPLWEDEPVEDLAGEPALNTLEEE